MNKFLIVIKMFFFVYSLFKICQNYVISASEQNLKSNEHPYQNRRPKIDLLASNDDFDSAIQTQNYASKWF